MKERKVSEHLKRRLGDPQFKATYARESWRRVVAKRILDCRIRCNLSQLAFAKKIGIHERHISRIENLECDDFEVLGTVLDSIGYSIRFSLVPVKS